MPRQIIIPFDVQINILSRLPVKSLQRFRCVCKQWSSLISTPYFIEEHYKRSSGRSPKITSRLLKKKVTLYDFDHATCDIKDSSYEIEHHDPIECKLSNSVNGLICGYDELKIGECHLVNPSTREVSKLPYTPRRVSKADKVGLGFDAPTGEYKVVRLLARGFDEDYECEILTVGTCEWKFIGKVPLPHHTGPVYSQGTLYWIVYVPQEQGGYCRAILRIDIKYEKFEVIPLIPALRNGCSIRLHELRGRVCVVTEPEIVNIWMLENDTKWVQVLSFCTKNCSRDYSSFAGLQQLIGISGDKILLEFFTHSSIRIRCHDLQNDTCDEIWKGTDRSLFFHRESLVSPRKLIGVQLE